MQKMRQIKFFNFTVMKLKLIRKYILFYALIAGSLWARGQDAPKFSFAYYDSLTYRQYLTGNWGGVIANGRKAMSYNFDYKYLRMRIGIAYFNKENYRLAADYFGKALKFDSYDTSAAAYFNLSCPPAGRVSEFYRPKNSRKPYKMIEFIYADASKMVMGRGKDNFSLGDSATVYKELTQPISRDYHSLGMSIRPVPKLLVFIGYSDLRLTDRKSFAYLTQEAVRDSVVDKMYSINYYYSFPASYRQEDLNTRQQSSYINLTYFPVPGLKITPAFNILKINANRLNATFTPEAYTDTAYYYKIDKTWHTFSDTAFKYTFSRSDTSFTNYVVSLAVNKDIGKINAGINGSFSRLYDRKVYQLGASLAWYPLGNTNLYTVSNLTFQKDSTWTVSVFEQMAGGKIYKNGWLEGFVTLGEMKNSNEKNAYLVYNQIYPMSLRWGITFYPFIGKHLEIMLIYKYHKIGSLLTTYKFINDESEMYETNPAYKFSTITGGIKWKL